MGDSNKKRLNFAKDTRTSCKYGAECYQKNPFHLSKFKHPSKTKNKGDVNESPNKKRKIINESNAVKATLNNVSDSEEDTHIASTSTSVAKTNENDNNLIKEVRKEEESNLKAKITNDVSDSEVESESLDKDLENGSTNKYKNIDTKIEDNEEERRTKSSNAETILDNDSFEENLEANNELMTSIISDSDKKEFIKTKFLVEMPCDFYSFWEFCKRINKNNPLFALRDVGLILVGPFEVLADKFDNTPERDAEEYLIHWRYFFDPPEFQTVLKGDDTTGYHIGYFRDSPSEPPVFLAYNNAKEDGILSEIGENIFAAVSIYLENLKKTCDPFKKMHVVRFASSIKAEAEKLNFVLTPTTQAMRNRKSKIVTKTFNKIGLVVPYNRRSQVGYRELAMSDKELKQLLDKIAVATSEQRDKLLVELQPVLTYASIATDECDFGTGIELGWNILFAGVESLNSTVSNFLATSYRLLDSHAFASIIEAHMKKRRKGSRLSIL